MQAPRASSLAFLSANATWTRSHWSIAFRTLRLGTSVPINLWLVSNHFYIVITRGKWVYSTRRTRRPIFAVNGASSSATVTSNYLRAYLPLKKHMYSKRKFSPQRHIPAELGLVPRLRVALPSTRIPTIDSSVAPVGNSDLPTGASLQPHSFLHGEHAVFKWGGCWGRYLFTGVIPSGGCCGSFSYASGTFGGRGLCITFACTAGGWWWWRRLSGLYSAVINFFTTFFNSSTTCFGW